MKKTIFVLLDACQYEAGTRNLGYLEHLIDYKKGAKYKVYILNWFSSELSAKLYGAWSGEGQSAFGLLKKNCAVDSAYIYFAVLLGRQGICCLFSRVNQRYFGSNCNDNYILNTF